MKTKIYFILLLISFYQVNASEIHVPTDYPTIQEAILAASSGDVVIVANGIYYENINFWGQAITVTSNFHFTGDINDIQNTIIDGSQPSDSDFGSCVTFSTGETQASILKGFTLTGGTGTKTYNPVEMLYFRTGGGILINQASPTITNNIIRDNECIAESGVFGAGGGGIRMGFGLPIIKNNIIKNNIGGYAGGIMIAYCEGAVLKNNVIANNTATGSFNGGGGVYVDWEPVTLENNTITNNHSEDKGGGIISTGTTTVAINCIIYGNTATNGNAQIYKRFGGNANVTFSNIEDGFDGVGNEEGVIDIDPLYDNLNNYLLSPLSPCIDAGNPDAQYNDIEDPTSLGNALLPSLGTIINDMGAYGGQGSDELLSKKENSHFKEFSIFYRNPYQNEGVYINSTINAKLKIQAFSFDGKLLVSTLALNINKGENFIPLNLQTSSLVVINDASGNRLVSKFIKK